MNIIKVYCPVSCSSFTVNKYFTSRELAQKECDKLRDWRLGQHKVEERFALEHNGQLFLLHEIKVDL